MSLGNEVNSAYNLSNNILRKFESELIKEGLKDKTITSYFNAIIDFDFYLMYAWNDWQGISEDDFIIYSEMLSRRGIEKISIKRRISRIRRFKEFYERITR